MTGVRIVPVTGTPPAGVLAAGVLAALQGACFPEDPWSAESIATLMEQPGHVAFLLVEGPAEEPRPLGFVLARAAAEDGEILTIGVLALARGRGHGALLVETAAAAVTDLGATAVFLEVAEDNAAARRLYAAAGFVAVGRRPGYYRRPDGRVAALVLRRDAALVSQRDAAVVSQRGAAVVSQRDADDAIPT